MDHSSNGIHSESNGLATNQQTAGPPVERYADTFRVGNHHLVPRRPGIYIYPECCLCMNKDHLLFEWRIDKCARLTAYCLSKNQQTKCKSSNCQSESILGLCPIHLNMPNIATVGEDDNKWFLYRFHVDIFEILDEFAINYLQHWRSTHSTMIIALRQDREYQNLFERGKPWTVDQYVFAVKWARSHGNILSLDKDSDAKFKEYSECLRAFWAQTDCFTNPVIKPCPQFDWHSKRWIKPDAINTCPLIINDKDRAEQLTVAQSAPEGSFGKLEASWLPMPSASEVRGSWHVNTRATSSQPKSRASLTAEGKAADKIAAQASAFKLDALIDFALEPTVDTDAEITFEAAFNTTFYPIFDETEWMDFEDGVGLPVAEPN